MLMNRMYVIQYVFASRVMNIITTNRWTWNERNTDSGSKKSYKWTHFLNLWGHSILWKLILFLFFLVCYTALFNFSSLRITPERFMNSFFTLHWMSLSIGRIKHGSTWITILLRLRNIELKMRRFILLSVWIGDSFSKFTVMTYISFHETKTKIK